MLISVTIKSMVMSPNQHHAKVSQITSQTNKRPTMMQDNFKIKRIELNYQLIWMIIKITLNLAFKSKSLISNKQIPHVKMWRGEATRSLLIPSKATDTSRSPPRRNFRANPHKAHLTLARSKGTDQRSCKFKIRIVRQWDRFRDSETLKIQGEDCDNATTT